MSRAMPRHGDTGGRSEAIPSRDEPRAPTSAHALSEAQTASSAVIVSTTSAPVRSKRTPATAPPVSGSTSM